MYGGFALLAHSLLFIITLAIIARVVEKTAWMLNSKNDVKTTCLG